MTTNSRRLPNYLGIAVVFASANAWSAEDAPSPALTLPAPSSVAAPAAPAPIEAEKPTGTLRVETTPPGARVFIDGIDSGVTPIRKEFARGDHAVWLSLTGFIEENRLVAVKGGSEAVFAPSLDPMPPPPVRFTATADIVYDAQTRLTWERVVPEYAINFGDAQSHCDGLALGGTATGWRLPTTEELASIQDVNARPAIVDSRVFPDVSRTWFWTGSPARGASMTILNFGNGRVDEGGIFTKNLVRCVH